MGLPRYWTAAWAVAAVHCLVLLEGPCASRTGRPLPAWGVGASSVPPSTSQELEAERRRLAGDVAGCLTVTMVDSYEDGWNGAEMVIKEEGATTTVWSGTLADGGLQTEHVCGLGRTACFGTG